MSRWDGLEARVRPGPVFLPLPGRLSPAHPARTLPAVPDDSQDPGTAEENAWPCSI